MKKILIIGSGRHGKDTVAEQIAICTGLTFISSSEYACSLFVREYLEDAYQMHYDSDEECFNDRHNHREKWYEIIKAYNQPKYTLAVNIIQDNDIYCGMRDEGEYQASRYSFDHVIYVDASDRVKYIDPTFKIPFDQGMICLENNGNQVQLRDDVFRLIDWLKL